jgi:hypothetical protein
MKDITGIDISANHGAFVALDGDTGNLEAWRAFTFKACDAKHDMHMDRLTTSKGKGQQAGMDRLYEVALWTRQAVRDFGDTSSHVAIEDYAFASKTAGQHSVAQVGGVLRSLLMTWGSRKIQIRLHIPGTVNLFVTGTVKNAGDKQAMRSAVIEAYPEAAQLPNDSEGDYIDAYILARLLWLELEIRAGRRSLESLTDGQRQVFLRVTKTYPENLLARPFLT